MLKTEQTVIRLQIFPHSENPQLWNGFKFTPIERDVLPNTTIRIGRKVDKHKTNKKEKKQSTAALLLQAVGLQPASVSANQPEPSQNTDQIDIESQQQEEADESSSSSKDDFIAFRSKVVSRNHAELIIDENGKVKFRDVGSSSGSFVNRLRLSTSGKPSQSHFIKSGDIIQLGVDYQGRQEEIYKCVMMRIFYTIRQPGQQPKKHPLRLKSALNNLVNAMGSTSEEGEKEAGSEASECCICLCTLSPYQALFLAPCSHCFHYTCVTPIIRQGVMFQCPLCRQVANLQTIALDEQETEVMEQVRIARDENPSVESVNELSGINITSMDTSNNNIPPSPSISIPSRTIPPSLPTHLLSNFSPSTPVSHDNLILRHQVVESSRESSGVEGMEVDEDPEILVRVNGLVRAQNAKSFLIVSLKAQDFPGVFNTQQGSEILDLLRGLVLKDLENSGQQGGPQLRRSDDDEEEEEEGNRGMTLSRGKARKI